MSIRSILTPILLFALSAFTAKAAAPYTIYPVPQSISATSGSFSLSRTINVVYDADVDALTRARLSEVLTRAGLSFSESSTPSGVAGNIVVGVYDHEGLVADYVTANGFDTNVFTRSGATYDAHIINVRPNVVSIMGNVDGSAFYAMASLEQMIEQAAGGEMPCVDIADYAHCRYRGIVEGFYGHPYSIESRLNLFDYMKRYKMNYYVYGPKADPYHAGNWRLDYPDTVTDDQRFLGQITTSDIATIAAHARECHVDFLWAIHPTLGGSTISLSWVSEIMTKFEQLHSLGVRHFGVSVDDMRGHPSNQCSLASQVMDAIDAKWNTPDANPADTVGNLLFVPTVYALNYGSNSVLTNMQSANPKVELAFTGYDCFSNLRAASVATMASLIGRDPVFWWNNPVNDDYDEFLYMHGLTARWTIEQQGPVDHLRGFMLNPMNQGQASKICVFSGADYSWNPTAFNEQASWEAAVRSLGKTDENTQALFQFIRILSAYTTHDTRTPEGEEFSGLYTYFQQQVEDGALPADVLCYNELLAQMTATLDAVNVMRSWADSSDPDLALLYTDMLPWIDKTEKLATICASTLRAMNGGKSALDNWTDIAAIHTLASTIHDATLSVLEGSGTSTYETMKEPQVGPKYLDSFAEFMAAKSADYMPSLPERDRSIFAITNCDEGATATLTENADGSLTLSAPVGVSLRPDCYIGACLNHIYKVSFRSLSIPAGYELEWSLSGKQWQPVTDTSDPEAMAYLRLRNATSESLAPFTPVTFTLPQSASAPTPTVSTNMSPYSVYALSRVIDGDPTSFFWSNKAQAAGQYITLDYGDIYSVGAITFTFTGDDQPQYNVNARVSTDGVNWTTVGTFTKSDLVNRAVTFQAGGIEGRYIQMMLTQAYGAWLQVAEMSAEMNRTVDIAVARDNADSPVTALDDRSLATAYTASGAEGFLIYDFIEHQDIRSIEIYHNSYFSAGAPATVSLLGATDEWTDLGTLQGPRTIVGVPTDLRHVSSLRIDWDKYAAIAIHDIVPIGPAYNDPDPELLAIDGIDATRHAITIARQGSQLTVSAPEAIATLTLTDLSGRTLIHLTPCTPEATITLPSTARTILRVTLPTGLTRTYKL